MANLQGMEITTLTRQPREQKLFRLWRGGFWFRFARKPAEILATGLAEIAEDGARHDNLCDAAIAHRRSLSETCPVPEAGFVFRLDG
jgi:hypothetical protein